MQVISGRCKCCNLELARLKIPIGTWTLSGQPSRCDIHDTNVCATTPEKAGQVINTLPRDGRIKDMQTGDQQWLIKPSDSRCLSRNFVTTKTGSNSCLAFRSRHDVSDAIASVVRKIPQGTTSIVQGFSSLATMKDVFDPKMFLPSEQFKMFRRLATKNYVCISRTRPHINQKNTQSHEVDSTLADRRQTPDTAGGGRIRWTSSAGSREVSDRLKAA